jgi:hypothetical protein
VSKPKVRDLPRDAGTLMVLTTTTESGPRVAIVMGDRGLDMSPHAALDMARALAEAAEDCRKLGAPFGDPQDAHLHDMADVELREGPLQ